MNKHYVAEMRAWVSPIYWTMDNLIEDPRFWYMAKNLQLWSCPNYQTSPREVGLRATQEAAKWWYLALKGGTIKLKSRGIPVKEAWMFNERTRRFMVARKINNKVVFNEYSVRGFFYLCISRGINNTRAEEHVPEYSHLVNAEEIEDKQQNRPRRNILKQIQKGLSKQHRQIVVLKTQGVKILTIAQKLGIGVTTIRRRIDDVRQLLTRRE